MTYAISFDLDTKTLQDSYPNPSWQNANFDIERALRQHGFTRRQGSVYFGEDSVDVVRCQTAVQTLALDFTGLLRLFETSACCGSRTTTT